MISIFRALSNTKSLLDEKSGSECREQLELFLRIKSYVLRGDYTSYGKKEVFFQSIYSGDRVLASKLDVSEKAVRKIKSRISAEAYSVLGSDVFDLLLANSNESLGKLKSIMDIVEKNYSSKFLFPAELLQMIHEVDCREVGKVFNVSDCIPEIVFLYWLQLSKLSDILSGVDANRLSYILGLIDFDIRDTSSRNKVLQALESIDIDSYFASAGFTKKDLKFPPLRADNDVIESDSSISSTSSASLLTNDDSNDFFDNVGDENFDSKLV